MEIPVAENSFVSMMASGKGLNANKIKAAWDGENDEQRKAIFAKTVGAHADAADFHEDLGDKHTAAATKLSTSKSPIAPKLAAAHTNAATMHYAASEAHATAKSDFTKANTATAGAASTKAFSASDKVDALPKPRGFSASEDVNAGGPGSGPQGGKSGIKEYGSKPDWKYGLNEDKLDRLHKTMLKKGYKPSLSS